MFRVLVVDDDKDNRDSSDSKSDSNSKSGGGSWLIEDAVGHAIDTASSMLGGGSGSDKK